MSGRSASVSTPAVAVLTSARVAFTVHAYDAAGGGRGYGEQAAAALNVDPQRLFKTLVVTARDLAVAVVPVAASLDLRALATALGVKRTALADPEAARRATGYVLGGISPLGQRTRLRTVVDQSATTFGTVFVSAGRRGLQVELAPDDLVRLTGATLAAIAG